MSKLYGNKEKNSTGYSHTIGFGKTGGRWNFNVSEELANDKYDISILFNNNYLDHFISTKKVNNLLLFFVNQSA